MKAYICINCAFSTTIKNRFEKCPICNNEFTQLTNKESKIFLNLNGDQRLQWIESKIGHSIPEELNDLRENYKQDKIQEISQKNEYEQKMKLNIALEHGKMILEEQSHQPECPTCHSKNIQRISGVERGASVVMLGLFSKKINKSFKCKNCGYTW